MKRKQLLKSFQCTTSYHRTAGVSSGAIRTTSSVVAIALPGVGVSASSATSCAVVFSRRSTSQSTKRTVHSLETSESSRTESAPGASVYGERANFAGLALGSIEADFSSQIFVGTGIRFEKEIEKKGTWKETEILWKAPAEIYTMHAVVQLTPRNLKTFMKDCRIFARVHKI